MRRVRTAAAAAAAAAPLRPPGLPLSPPSGARLCAPESETVPPAPPTLAELLEYAKWLGMDPVKEKELMWIAREGLKAPLPEHWKPCRTGGEELYYFNFQTGESMWEHPCDEYYKTQYAEEKKKLQERETRRAREGEQAHSPRKNGGGGAQDAGGAGGGQRDSGLGKLGPLVPLGKGAEAEAARDSGSRKKSAPSSTQAASASKAAPVKKAAQPQARPIAVPTGAVSAGSSNSQPGGVESWQAAEVADDAEKRKAFKRHLEEERKAWEADEESALGDRRARIQAAHRDAVAEAQRAADTELQRTRDQLQLEQQVMLKDLRRKLEAKEGGERARLEREHAQKLEGVVDELDEQLARAQAERQEAREALEAECADLETQSEKLQSEKATVEARRAELEKQRKAAGPPPAASYDASYKAEVEAVKKRAQEEARALEGGFLEEETERVRAGAREKAQLEESALCQAELERVQSAARSKAEARREELLAEELARVRQEARTAAREQEADVRAAEIEGLEGEVVALKAKLAEEKRCLEEEVEAFREGSGPHYHSAKEEEIEKARASARLEAGTRRESFLEAELRAVEQEAKMAAEARRAELTDAAMRQVRAEAEAHAAAERESLLETEMRAVRAEVRAETLEAQRSGDSAGIDEARDAGALDATRALQEELERVKREARAEAEAMRPALFNEALENLKAQVQAQAGADEEAEGLDARHSGAASSGTFGKAPQRQVSLERGLHDLPMAQASGDLSQGVSMLSGKAKSPRRRKKAKTKRRSKAERATEIDGAQLGDSAKEKFLGSLESFMGHQRAYIKERRANLSSAKVEYGECLKSVLVDATLDDSNKKLQLLVLNSIREQIHSQAHRLNEDARQLKYLKSLPVDASEEEAREALAGGNDARLSTSGAERRREQRDRRLSRKRTRPLSPRTPDTSSGMFLVAPERSGSGKLLSNVSHVLHHVENKRKLLMQHSLRLGGIQKQVEEAQRSLKTRAWAQPTSGSAALVPTAR